MADYLSVKEVAEACDVSLITVRRWVTAMLGFILLLALLAGLSAAPAAASTESILLPDRVNTSWIPVDSTAFDAIAYQDRCRCLNVQFDNGSGYRYYKVPRRVFNQLRYASSIGGYYNSHIKGRYRSWKMYD